jgi:YcaO-like protein with predicted kinase domain
MLTLGAVLESGAKKSYFRGTHRSLDPAETWDNLHPLLSLMGITRVANVTGLDRIGIPVYMSCRPNSRSLAVSQGKGIEPMSARVSAVMESAETWHAEFNQSLVRLESFRELRRSDSVCDAESLPLCKGSLFSDDRPIPWILGADLLCGKPVWVPHELVHANTTLPAVPGSGCFLASTNGLASGNNIAEAVLHALYEVVERDALAMWELATPNRWNGCRVDCDSIHEPSCLALIELYRSARITPMVWNITSDVGLPAFVAIIFDEESDHLLHPIPAAFGSGCHCDSGVALSRALTEAAQSRLTAIAGSRDDLTRENYRSSQSEAAFEYHRDLARATEAPVDFRLIPSFSAAGFTDDLLHVLRCLGRAGIGQIVAIDLSRPEFPISVVRVIAVGLEGPTESRWYRPGKRLRARML